MNPVVNTAGFFYDVNGKEMRVLYGLLTVIESINF